MEGQINVSVPGVAELRAGNSKENKLRHNKYFTQTDRVAALFVDCVTDLLIDHLALLLGDRLRHRLTLLLLLGPAVFLVHNVAPGDTKMEFN